MDRPPPKNLSPQEWETLIEDFQYGGSRLGKWTSQFSPLSLLLDLSLSSLLKTNLSISLKLNLLIFLDEFSLLFHSPSPSPSAAVDHLLSKLNETLRILIQTPNDGVSITYALKDQMMVSATSITITVSSESNSLNVSHLESLVAILLTVINRPNHGADRHSRAVACECLRELERAFPCLLGEVVGHLWQLCQSERTHASQSYMMLLLQVIHGVAVRRLNVGSIVGSGIPLVPFNVPQWLRNDDGYGGDRFSWGGELISGELSASSMRELKRVVAFLFEWTHMLTPSGMLEFMTLMLPVAAALELQASMLRVQFLGLLYTFDPLMAHAVLVMYVQFPEAFDGLEGEIARRLILMSKEGQRHLVFRLLALHWLMGFTGFIVGKDARKKKVILEMGLSFYPSVYDALALKLLKLDLLAFCAISVDSSESEGLRGEGQEGDSILLPVKYLVDGLLCVSAFKWLPAWSTETAVAFRTLHKFLIGASSHSDTDSSTSKILMQSTIFVNIQRMLVSWASCFQKLVPMVVVLVDRLLHCQKHCWLGENLLQIFDRDLLPKLVIDYRLTSYFPIFDRIGRSDKTPPGKLLDLLTTFMIFLVKSHGPDTRLKSWLQASKVLSICRTMLMHHKSSRLFSGLSHLLTFASLYFPDLEVRDNARIYLRMLICVPGNKLRHTLNLGEQVVGISPSPHAASFFNVQSPRFSQDQNKSKGISSYIHLERVMPLLVKQSWSLALPALSFEEDNNGYIEGIKDSGSLLINEADKNADIRYTSEPRQVSLPNEPLLVMDSKLSQILGTLRKHFSCIPDFRHMVGIRIKISCTLRFEAEPFKRIWGVNSLLENSLEEIDVLPAIYAAVLKFSSSGPYGSIPSYHIPFLLGEQASNASLSSKRDAWEIVPVENRFVEERSRAHVTVELEPREPVPGLVDVFIEANSENGQIVNGQLISLSIGIEDMFLRPILPIDITGEAVADYYSDLFDALWEACGASSNTGREMFLLKGSKGAAAISGTQSVKLLDVFALDVIHAVERCLSPFVVSVIGESLVKIVKDGGVIQNATWKDYLGDYVTHSSMSMADSMVGPLYLTYFSHEDDKNGHRNTYNTNMGWFLVLIFLPPRYHLLFRVEVSDVSTLVRIRTDHWPCLAYVDDYLEALFSS